jgi:hypothetical protein
MEQKQVVGTFPVSYRNQDLIEYLRTRHSAAAGWAPPGTFPNCVTPEQSVVSH